MTCSRLLILIHMSNLSKKKSTQLLSTTTEKPQNISHLLSEEQPMQIDGKLEGWDETKLLEAAVNLSSQLLNNEEWIDPETLQSVTSRWSELGTKKA